MQHHAKVMHHGVVGRQRGDGVGVVVVVLGTLIRPESGGHSVQRCSGNELPEGAAASILGVEARFSSVAAESCSSPFADKGIEDNLRDACIMELTSPSPIGGIQL